MLFPNSEPLVLQWRCGKAVAQEMIVAQSQFPCMEDNDWIAVELNREQWRQVQVRLMQVETPEVPDVENIEFQAIVEEIDDQLLK